MSTRSSHEMTPAEIVDNGYRDVVSPFIKDEPHPPRKAEVGAWRIVQCVSLIDQLVERVIYERPVFSIKSQYPRSDAVVGIGFTDVDTKEFHAIARSMGPSMVATDVSGWDRSLGEGWVLEAAEAIIRSADIPNSAWENCVRNHAYGITRPVFIVPDKEGHSLVTRNEPGGMLSGSYLTTTFNTLARLDVANAAGALMAKAAGDDCLELFPPNYDYVQEYADIGFTIRETVTPDGTFEFCSHLYDDRAPSAASLTSWMKLISRYFRQKHITAEHYIAALHELRHNDELPLIRELLKSRYEADKPSPGTGEGQNSVDSEQN